MMKYILLFISIISTAMAQRPSFAGSRVVGVPDVASRFANTNTDSSTSASSAGAAGGEFPSRFGADGSASTMRIPVDARGDQNLVNRLETWPRENQPFWLINAQHIENQRNPGGTRNNGPTNGQVQGSSQSVTNRNGEEQNQVIGNRANFGPGHLPENPNAQSYFSVFMNNQLKTYVYDPSQRCMVSQKIVTTMMISVG